MALRGTDPKSYITEYTLVYADKEPGLTKLVNPNPWCRPVSLLGQEGDLCLPLSLSLSLTLFLTLPLNLSSPLPPPPPGVP